MPCPARAHVGKSRPKNLKYGTDSLHASRQAPRHDGQVCLAGPLLSAGNGGVYPIGVHPQGPLMPGSRGLDRRAPHVDDL